MSEDEHRDDEIADDETVEVEPTISDSESVLENLTDVGEEDLRVYSLVLTMGNVTTGDLFLLMGNVELPSIEESISRLKEKKMIVEYPGIISRFKAIPPFEGLANEVGQISEKISALKTEVKEQIRTASASVRDALIELTRSNLSTIDQQETDTKSAKMQSISSVKSSIEKMEESVSSAQQGFDGQIQTTVTGWKTETTSNLDSFLNGVQETVVTSNRNSSNSLQEWTTSTKEKLEHYRSELELKITSFETSAKDSINTQTTAVADSLDSQSTKIESDVKLSIEKLQRALERNETSVESLTKSTSNEFVDKLSTAHDSMNRHMETAAKEIEVQYNSLSEGFKSIVEAMKDSHESIVTQYSEAINPELTKLVEKQTAVTNAFTTSIEEKSTEFKTGTESIISSISNQIESLERRSQSSISGAQQSMINLSTTALDTSFRIVSETSFQSIEESRLLIERKKESVRNNLESIGESLKSLNRDTLDLTTTLLEETKSSLATIAAQTNQETSIAVNGEIAKLESALANRMAASSQKSSEITSMISEKLAEMKKSHDEVMDRFHQDISTKQETMIGKIDTSRREAIGNLESSIQEIADQTSNGISLASSESRELIATLNGQLADTTDIFRTKSISLVDEISAATRVFLNTLKESTNEFVSSVRTQVETSGSDVMSSVSTVVSDIIPQTRAKFQELNEELSTEIESTKTTLQAGTSETINSHKIAFGQTTEQITTSAETSISEIAVALDDVKGKVSDSLRDLSFSITEQSGQLRSKSVTLSEGVVTDLGNSIATWSSDIESKLSTFESDMKSHSDKMNALTSEVTNDLREKMVDMVQQEQTRSLQSFKESSGTVETAIGTGYSNLEDKLTLLKNTLGGTLQRLEETPMLGLSESALDSALTSSTVGDIESQDVAGMLSSIWDRVNETDFPGAKKTWTVVTRAAVSAQIADMIVRTKSKATVIVPKSEDIPVEILKELKRTAGVDIVVTEDAALGHTVRSLISLGNIRVRVRQESDVYACVRDSEEVLIAPAAIKDHDVIGFVSEDEGFIKFIMGVVGPILMAKAKLLKQGDI
ncbi:MAG: hypothetical protein ACTSQZ_04755 [Candidatus Thorarchaeota archaeon]